ncbi:MAG: aspartyl protease family protein, partial [Bacteroides sp.]
IYLCSILTLTGCAQTQTANPRFEDLDQLLTSGQFITLKQELQRATRSFGNNPYQYYDAHCYNAFGEYNKSILAANRMLVQYAKSMNHEELIRLLDLQARNYHNTYHYKQSAELYASILNRLNKHLSEEMRINYQNHYIINKTLAEAQVGKQQAHIKQDYQIPIFHNQFDHLMVPVASKAKHDHFILDTGAMISTISASNAERLGFRILDSKIEVDTSTNISIQTKLGIADSLYLGDILLENVVFLVTDDSDLYIAQEDYKIAGILGFPVLQQLKEIRINLPENRIEVPLTPSKRDFTNLYMYKEKPVVRMYAGQDTLRMALDTGANKSELSLTYFNRHQEEIKSVASYKEVERGSAGGSIKEQVYIYPNFEFKLGSKKATLPLITINLSDYHFITGMDGNLGQDVYTQFDKLVMNFQQMFIDFE